ncbi:hypothetical protein F5B21DRAFT_107121 [Xylaria acuta]|nr:hypothetical protein F5B21DRAFT_107121 [Xylaria acuta]
MTTTIMTTAVLCKAARFCDRDTQRRVLATDSPEEQKRLGKLTAGFTNASWDEIKSVVVAAANCSPPETVCSLRPHHGIGFGASATRQNTPCRIENIGAKTGWGRP